MKRRLLAVALAASLVPLLACRSFPLGPASGRLDRILERRELRVGLSADRPPLNMKTRTGEVIGLEVDLVSALAESMGLSLRIVELPFADLLPAVEAGELDLAISGLTITPERNARAAFAGPYFISGKSLLTKSGAIARTEEPADLDAPRRVYAALAGSTSADFVKKWAPSSVLVTTPDYDTAVHLVIDGEVDALVADLPLCEVSLLRYPEAGLSTPGTPFTAEPLGIALPADDPLLVNLIQNHLAALESTGTLTALQARWFSHGPWLSELP